MATNGKNRQVKFNDGEGLEFADLNNLQTFMKAHYMDQMLAGATSNFLPSVPGFGSSPDYAYVPSASNCTPFESATALQIRNTAGVLCQWVGTPDGATHRFLSYYFNLDELVTTLNAGDGANPRIDGIFIKLEAGTSTDTQSRDFKDATTGALSTTTPSKRSEIAFTKTVVEGTPAGSPVPPSTPVGYVPWCYVYVPTAYASAFGTSHLSDYRVPMSFKSVKVSAHQMIPSGGAAISGNSISLTGLQSAQAVVPLDDSAKLISVEYYGDFSGSLGGTAILQTRLMATNGLISPWTGFTSTFSLDPPTSAAARVHSLVSNHSSRTAWWGSGQSAWYTPRFTLSGVAGSSIEFSLANAGGGTTIIRGVTFWYAD